MDSTNQNPNLGEAVRDFLASLPTEERGRSQQAVYGFVRWYGWERPFAELTAHGLESYAEQLSLTQSSYPQTLEIIRSFLLYAKKQGWSKTNLATHLKARKVKAVTPSPRQDLSQATSLTQQGYAKLAAELAELKSRRLDLIEEMRRAAADKDFRENAPLHAAREERGHVEGRIMELEQILKSATIIEEAPKPELKICLGDSVILSDILSGEEIRYTIVSPKEVDPSKGKISSNSPTGKALVGRAEGETVEIMVPMGRLRYKVKRIER